METPFRGTFYPLGQPLAVESNDRLVLDCAFSSYGHFRRGASPGRPIRLRLLRDPQATSGPPWPRAVYRSGKDLLAIVCGGENLAVAELQRKYAVGFFSAAMLNDLEFFRWTFLDCLTYVLLTHHHFTPVHAAGVVRQGKGLCLCGPAGAGKTSLAYYCARHGYALLADDAVYLTRGSGSLRLRGNPARLHFPLEARQLFPELVQWPVSLCHDGQEFLVVSSESEGIALAVSECRPGALVFLDRGAKTGLKRVSAREATGLLFQTLPLDDPRTMDGHRRTIARLVRCGAYRMGYNTLQEALELLKQIAR